MGPHEKRGPPHPRQNEDQQAAQVNNFRPPGHAARCHHCALATPVVVSLVGRAGRVGCAGHGAACCGGENALGRPQLVNQAREEGRVVAEAPLWRVSRAQQEGWRRVLGAPHRRKCSARPAATSVDLRRPAGGAVASELCQYKAHVLAKDHTYSLLAPDARSLTCHTCTAQPCRGRLLWGRGAVGSPPWACCRRPATQVASRGLFGYERRGREPQIVLLFRSRRIWRDHPPHHVSTSLLHDTTSEYLSVINHVNDIPSPLLVVCTTIMGPCRYFCSKTLIMGTRTVE